MVIQKSEGECKRALADLVARDALKVGHGEDPRIEFTECGKTFATQLFFKCELEPILDVLKRPTAAKPPRPSKKRPRSDEHPPVSLKRRRMAIDDESSSDGEESQAFMVSGSMPQHPFLPVVERSVVVSNSQPVEDNLDEGGYELVLLLDNREIRSQRDRSYFEDCLQQRDILVEVRPLPLGDCLWVARPRGRAVLAGSQEIMVDCILERKRMDDLCGSIRDGRYAEQKYRMGLCGLANRFYLVEGSYQEWAADSGMAENDVEVAMINTMISSHLNVITTAGMKDSVDHLVSLHRLLERNLAKYLVPDLTYTQFRHKNKRTNPTVKNQFGCMLRQIKGLSGGGAKAIIDKYCTLPRLVADLRMLGPAAVANLVPERCQRKLGPRLGSRIHRLFTLGDYEGK